MKLTVSWDEVFALIISHLKYIRIKFHRIPSIKNLFAELMENESAASASKTNFNWTNILSNICFMP